MNAQYKMFRSPYQAATAHIDIHLGTNGPAHSADKRHGRIIYDQEQCYSRLPLLAKRTCVSVKEIDRMPLGRIKNLLLPIKFMELSVFDHTRDVTNLNVTSYRT